MEKQIQITRWDLGMAKEKRNLANGYFKYLENVEVGDFFQGVKQVPNVASAEGTKAIKTIIEAGSNVYGLGKNAGGDTTIYKSVSTAGATPTFDTITNGTATGYVQNTGSKPFFAYYGTTLYYASNGYIGSYVGTTNTPNLVVAAVIQGGVVHRSKIYGWIGQDIYEFNPSTNGLANMITIPSDQTIVDLIPLGDNLAIICTSNAISTPSKAYIWDRVTTTTFLDVVDIGYGDVVGADILDGTLLVVVGFINRQGFRIKKYTGSIFTNEITYFAQKNTVASFKYVVPASLVSAFTNYIYFLARISRPGSDYANYEELVLFRYGKTDETKQNALSVYKTIKTGTSTLGPINCFVISESFSINGDIDIPAKFIIASIADGATMDEIATQLSSGDAVYSAQAGAIETGIYTGGDSSIEKKLSEMSIRCEPLTAGQSIALYYKPDADTSWTEIETIDTVGTITYEPVSEADGSNLRTSKEVAFRFLLLGGAEITGFSARYEEELGTR